MGWDTTGEESTTEVHYYRELGCGLAFFDPNVPRPSCAIKKRFWLCVFFEKIWAEERSAGMIRFRVFLGSEQSYYDPKWSFQEGNEKAQ